MSEGGASVGHLVRTNVVIDEDLVTRVMGLYGLASRREAIDFALRHMANVEERRRKTLELEGSGWEGNLDEMRRGEIADP
jgi:Arc/MetJ family transcription regulator